MKAIFARTVFDSTGTPTVEVDLITDLGLFRAAVPSSLTAGIYEAQELRDQSNDYHGNGVAAAIDNINTIIAPELLKQDFDVTEQDKVDQFLIDLDKTPNKSKFGSNAILGISLAVCKAGAAKRGLPLYRHIADLAGIKDLIIPVPAFNVLSGGTHAGNKLTFQEFLILPTGATSFAEAMKMGSEVYHHLKKVIQDKYKGAGTAQSNEGGFAPPNLKATKDALQFIVKAIRLAGYTGRVEIGIDAAASEFFKKGAYNLDFKNPKSNPKKFQKPANLLKTYTQLLKTFPIVSLEDPFDKEDFNSWKTMTEKVDIQIVADELTATNPQRIQQAIEQNACNCALLRINQIGTISEAIKIHLFAKENGWGTMVAHTSGETEDTFIADLAVGLSTGQIKCGAPSRSERIAKYNQILRIEEELGKDVRYAGKAFMRPL
ncbi:enolase-like [Diorhabda sublineata]|uniref:enolase-like n=1 Tax=Diorhabda sublineata TaxID=1163346 RepID=UPI0024E11C4D|nr:enolase-like [Diorhabda sublineata]